MKSRIMLPIILGLLVILIISTTMPCSAYTPYIDDSISKNASPVEAFNDRLSYTNNDKTTDFDDRHSIEGITKGCKKVYGFDGLFCNPENVDKSLDIYATAQGKLDCNGSGLTNSKGSLCLDNNQKKMLQTRGGNNKVSDAEIG